MGFTKDAECDEAEHEEDDNTDDHCCQTGSRRPSDDWLGLSHQPLQGRLPALPLQLCSNHLPARPVVLVQPVPLQERREVTNGVHAFLISHQLKPGVMLLKL